MSSGNNRQSDPWEPKYKNNRSPPCGKRTSGPGGNNSQSDPWAPKYKDVPPPFGPGWDRPQYRRGVPAPSSSPVHRYSPRSEAEEPREPHRSPWSEAEPGGSQQRGRVQDRDSELHKYRARCEELQDKLRKLQEKYVQALNNQPQRGTGWSLVQSLTEESRSLKRRVQELEQSGAHLEAKVQERDARLARLSGERELGGESSKILEEAQREVAAARQQLALKSVEVQILQEELTKVRSCLQNQQDVASHISKVNQQLMAQARDLTSQLGALTSERDALLNSMRDREKSPENDHAGVTSTLVKELTTENAALKSELKEMVKKLENDQVGIKSTQVKELTTENAALKSELKEMEKKLKNDQVGIKSTQVEELTTKNAALKSELKEMEKKLENDQVGVQAGQDSSAEEWDTLLVQVKKIKKQLENDQVGVQETQIKKLTEERDSLILQVEEMQVKLEEYQGGVLLTQQAKKIPEDDHKGEKMAEDKNGVGENKVLKVQRKKACKLELAEDEPPTKVAKIEIETLTEWYLPPTSLDLESRVKLEQDPLAVDDPSLPPHLSPSLEN